MAQKVLFAKQTVSGFAPKSDLGGLYYCGFNFPESGATNGLTDSFTLEVGGTYSVYWDGTEYEVIGQDASALVSAGTVVLGNASAFGLSGNNEPFVVICTNGMGVGFASVAETVDSHIIGVYQEVADEEPAEPEKEEHIVLKDRNGNDIEYQGIDILHAKTTTGGTKGFASFKDGELIPGNIAKGIEFGGVTGTMEVPASVEKTVELDFSAGSMEVTPESGQVFSKVNIPVPENLAPSVIAEGVDIAGIIGTLAAGGSGGNIVCMKKETAFANNASSTSYTVKHGLGVVPDIVFSYETGTGSMGAFFMFGLSAAMSAKLGSVIPKNLIAYNSGGRYVSTKDLPIETTDSAYINNANEQTVTFNSRASGYGGFYQSTKQTVYCIAGLT